MLEEAIEKNRIAAEEMDANRTLHDLYVRLKNPLIYDYEGGTFKDKSYSELVQEAIDEGHDGVTLAPHAALARRQNAQAAVLASSSGLRLGVLLCLRGGAAPSADGADECFAGRGGGGGAVHHAAGAAMGPRGEPFGGHRGHQQPRLKRASSAVVDKIAHW
jgi:hypothetical protein